MERVTASVLTSARAASSAVFRVSRSARDLSYTQAAITHNIMPDVQEKVAFTFGLYMRTFYAGRIPEVLGKIGQ